MTISLTQSQLRAKLIFLGLSLIYRLALDLFFIQFSSDFAYYGLIYLPRTTFEILLSWLSIAVAALTIDYSVKRPSNSIHLMLFLFCLVPASVHYALNSNMSGISFYGLLSFFLLAPMISAVLKSVKRVSLPALRENEYRNLIIGAFGFALALVVYSYGFSFNISSLTDVYEQRDAFKAASGKGAKYLVQWLANVLNIALVLWSLVNRRYIITFFSLGLSVYLFSLGGHKSFLFVAPLAAALYVLVKFFREEFNLAVIISLVTSIVLLLIYDLASEKEYSLPSSLFVRRTILLPSQIYYYYCDYFMLHEVNLFSQNIPFRFFMTSPYEEKIPEIIGRNYFHFKEDVYANGNVFADTFSNLGLFSFPVLAVILPSIYSMIDWASSNKHLAFSIPLIFMTAHTLLNSGLIVTLITHGLLLGIVVLMLYPKNLWRINKVQNNTSSG